MNRASDKASRSSFQRELRALLCRCRAGAAEFALGVGVGMLPEMFTSGVLAGDPVIVEGDGESVLPLPTSTSVTRGARRAPTGLVPLKRGAKGCRSYEVKTLAHLAFPLLRRASLGYGNIATSKVIAVEFP